MNTTFEARELQVRFVTPTYGVGESPELEIAVWVKRVGDSNVAGWWHTRLIIKDKQGRILGQWDDNHKIPIWGSGEDSEYTHEYVKLDGNFQVGTLGVDVVIQAFDG
jgi:hypothetical protein